MARGTLLAWLASTEAILHEVCLTVTEDGPMLPGAHTPWQYHNRSKEDRPLNRTNFIPGLQGGA